MKKRIFLGWAAATAAAAVTAGPALGRDATRWNTAWIASPQPAWTDDFPLPLGLPRHLADARLRQFLRVGAGGASVRLVVSNAHGAHPLAIAGAAVDREGGSAGVPVRFDGRNEVVVAPGAEVASDPADLSVRAGHRLQVDMTLRDAELAGFHWDARERNQLAQGHGSGTQETTARAFLSAVLVPARKAANVVVALGDSLTDGNGATPGADQRWPDHLARRLEPSGVTVLNAGISGNRLLRDGMGPSALARFDRDVLRHPGVRCVIALLGTNDIGWPGGPFAPREPLPTLAMLQRGYAQMAERAHGRGVRFVAATLPPFENALQGTPLEGHFSAEKEALRQAFNAWIRSAGLFDAVTDFDGAVRDPSRPVRLHPDLDSGDHLHPGDAGYRAMAQAVDLKAVLGQAAKEPAP